MRNMEECTAEDLIVQTPAGPKCRICAGKPDTAGRITHRTIVGEAHGWGCLGRFIREIKEASCKTRA
jgi:hypothetical protein